LAVLHYLDTGRRIDVPIRRKATSTRASKGRGLQALAARLQNSVQTRFLGLFEKQGGRGAVPNAWVVHCRPQLVKGFMQLYSVEQKRSQALEAHAAAFSTLTATGTGQQSIVISFAQKTFTNGVLNSKLHVIELGAQPGAGDGKGCPKGGGWDVCIVQR
jgi:hypothetical protein